MLGSTTATGEVDEAEDRRDPPFRLEYRPALDGVRGIAIALVVVYHLGELLWPDLRGWLLPGGFIAVDVFFALSGFLITSLLLSDYDRRGRVDLVGFLRRRLERLWPALAFVLVALLAVALVEQVPHDATELAERSLWTMAFLQNAPMHDHLVHPELAQTWTVAVEGHFYLAWSVTAALVLALVHRRPRQVLVALALAGIVAIAVSRAFRFDDVPHPLGLFPTTENRLDGPLVGSIAGIAYASGWLHRVTERGARAMIAFGLACLSVLVFVAEPFSETTFKGGFTAIVAIAAVLVVGSAMATGGVLSRVLGSTVLAGLGKVSYSLYLWHMPVYVILNREATDWYVPLRAAVALVVTAALTAVSYVLVERPILRRSARRRSARAGTRVTGRDQLVEELVGEQRRPAAHGEPVETANQLT